MFRQLDFELHKIYLMLSACLYTLPNLFPQQIKLLVLKILNLNVLTLRTAILIRQINNAPNDFY